ncbi:MAG: PAS domain S-box protein [Candidatus Peribacteraceae bacterium]|nr:PAS domain S-box protein [Candidatus Peribacteraceae bacterium]
MNPKHQERAPLKDLAHKGIFGYPLEYQNILNHKKDETLRRIQEHRRRLSEDKETERLHILAETIPQIVWTAETNGFQDYFNKRWFEYTGFTEEETYLGKTALHPDDFTVYLERWSQALATGEEYEAEYRFLRHDGMYRWHLVRGLPVRDANGTIVKWFGTFTDIDDTKKLAEHHEKMAEELDKMVAQRTAELMKNNQFLEAEIQRRMKLEERDHANLARMISTIDIMPMGAVIIDENEIILYINQHYCMLFSLHSGPEHWVGQKSAKLFELAMSETNSKELYLQRMRHTIQHREPNITQELHVRGDRTLMCDYLPITVSNDPRGHLLLYRDITRKKRTDVAKSEFMSLASHQLRTPLTAIRWAVGRLNRNLGDKANDYQRRLLNELKNSIVRMATTITTMLTISRIESGKVTPKISTHSACSLLNKATSDFADDLRNKNQTLHMTCDEAVTLKTDADLINEVFKNLLSNAIKYTPDGGDIFIESDEKDGAVIITIRDTGVGIPAYQQDKIFTKFFRADNVVHESTDGTGVGLYLTASLMRLLSGTVAFHSAEGKGTTFSLIFE